MSELGQLLPKLAIANYGGFQRLCDRQTFNAYATMLLQREAISTGFLASVLTRDWLKRRELTETGGDNFPERFAFNDLLDQFIDPRGGRPLAALAIAHPSR
jgi:hypothetical protein